MDVGPGKKLISNSLTGSIYGEVVRKCLAVNVRERTEKEAVDLSRFMTEISTTLDKCYA
jgi:hypothetical protein